MTTLDFDLWHQYRVLRDGGIAFQLIGVSVATRYKNWSFTIVLVGLCFSIECTY
jgi:hypothetical protein